MPMLRDEPRILGLAAQRELTRRQRQRQMLALFPETGPYARDRYPKHLDFFRAGATHRDRLFIAANRVGKTIGGCFEDSLHLTGLYDTYAPWWEGRRFSTPVRGWVWGDSDEKIKETVQDILLGPPNDWGTGLIPGEHITKIERAASPIKDVVDTVQVRHASGGVSRLQFKSYAQGRKAAEGTFQHFIHGDEEMPLDIKTECLLRTMSTGDQAPGLFMLTFTPLQGLSETVLSYMPDGQLPEGPQDGEQYVVNAEWDDVPHLSESERASLLALIPPYQRDARTRGLPILGAGAIYPVPEDDYLVDPFEIPKHWRRAYALDVGWNRTAAVWGALDPEQDRWTLYHEHYGSHAEPSIHARAIQAPGAWIRGVIDPASRGRSQEDGKQLIQTYMDLGLDLTAAINAVETGLYQVWELLSTGRIKVFRTLSNWRKECRLYHRDEKGRIVKANDHLMDCTRYLVMSGKEVAQCEAPTAVQVPTQFYHPGRGLWGRR